MKRWFVQGALWVGLACGLGTAQAPFGTLPPAVLTAKTIAILNDTNDRDLTRGAEKALASWGQFQLIQDPMSADITLHFERVKNHSGQGATTEDPDTGKWSSSYGVTFGSSIHMSASLKDGDTPFYKTHTDDSKAKAGMECVNDFHTAYRTARQQAAQPTP